MTKSSPLLDLPRELLALVYSMLEIGDRIRMNISLPKGAVIARALDKDRQLVVIRLFFKRRIRMVGAPAVQREDTSSAMRRFFQENNRDPTILRIVCELPQLAQLTWKPSVDPLALFMGQNHMLGIVWANDEKDAASVVYAVQSRGTPAIFDCLMATDNLVRAHVVRDPGSFVFGLVSMSNTQGLLSHVMQLGEDNDRGFSVATARRYLSSLSISRIFLPSPLKLKNIVDAVGIPTAVLEDLLEEAAMRLLLPTVDLLMQAGARL